MKKLTAEKVQQNHGGSLTGSVLAFFYTAQYPLLEDWILLHKLTISIIPHMHP